MQLQTEQSHDVAAASVPAIMPARKMQFGRLRHAAQSPEAGTAVRMAP